MLSQEFYDALHKLEQAEPSPGREAFSYHHQPSDNTYLAHIADDDPRLLELRAIALRDEAVGKRGKGAGKLIEFGVHHKTPRLKPEYLHLDKIREARKERGWNQGTTANKLGIDKTTYGRMERGQNLFTEVQFRRLAWMFDTDPNDWINHTALSEPVYIEPWHKKKHDEINGELNA